MAALVQGLTDHRLPLFFHTIYLINLASPYEDLRRSSAEALAHALTLGSLAGAAGVVTHVGSHRGEGFEKGCLWAVDTTAEALGLARTALAAQGREPLLPPLLLETGAGAGTVMGAQLEQLAALLEALSSVSAAAQPGIGICLDTAHLFAAGYPVHQADGLDSVIGSLRTLGLLDKVGLVHLNDSSAPFASNRDLHENPGDGEIGYVGLAKVVSHPALAHIPFVLEVPGADGRGPDAAAIAVVKAMRAGRLKPAGATSPVVGAAPVRPAGPAVPVRRRGPAPGA
jgi:deoxyribonuclease-4